MATERACTGLTARWCPVHGSCTCDPEGDMDNGDCPLHRPSSPHPSVRRRVVVRRHQGRSEPNLTTCPYFGRHYRLPGHDPKGICGFGCYEEPACVTG